MAHTADDLMDRYQRLRSRHSNRDVKMQQVRLVREGRMRDIAPRLFPQNSPFSDPIVANMIDVAARDMAEMLAPLPAFNCVNPSMTSARQREKAALRTKVANGYVSHSNLQVQMYSAADWYVTYGFLPLRVDFDFDNNMPIIRALDPVGTYPEMDRFGRVISLFRRVVVHADTLKLQYPQFAKALDDRTDLVEVIFFHDKDEDVVFLPGGGDAVILERSPNPIGKCLVRVAARPGGSDTPRGQFDDVIFVQLAKARFALLALQAAQESVYAPLVVPSDVGEIPVGPNATIRTNNPQGVGRVPLNVPAEAFSEQAQLERELQLGSRFPQARTGNVDSSIVTGQGVKALMDGYDTQVRTHQAVFANALQEIMALAFEVDEVLFGDLTKRIRGTEHGASYTFEYTPKKAIEGDYTVDVRYGLMAGLDPSRWLVWGLQARSEKLLSRDTLRREMPMDMDTEEESKKVDIEDLEEAAKQAVLGYAQAIPALAANGQDPTGAITALTKVLAGRRKGKPITELMEEAFAPPAPPEPTPEELAAMQQAQAPMSPEEQMMMEMQGGMPPGQEEIPPEQTSGIPMSGSFEQRPDVQQLLAGLTAGGDANLQANVARQRFV